MSVIAEECPTTMTPALRACGVSKTFTGSRALRSFDLEIAPGEVHALLGENGSGKSTFIKVLSGFHSPDEGSAIKVAGQAVDFGSHENSYHLGCRFVHQDLGLIDTSSILDNLSFNGGFETRFGSIRTRMNRRRASEDLRRVGLDLNPERLVQTLSPAERTGVALARALREDRRNPVKVLVLDEPTAALPESEVAHLMAMVRTVAARGVAVLYVTHRLDEVFELADNVTVLRDGTKVAERPTRSLTRKDLVTLLVGNELEEVSAASASAASASELAAPVLSATDLCAEALAGVSFEARPGEVIGIAGITGSGRDAVLGAVFGATERTSGSVRLDGFDVPPGRPAIANRVGMAFMPADRKLLGGIMDLTARENLTIADLSPFWRRGPILRRGRERAETAGWFDRMDVRPRIGLEQPLASFSGGNQQKILIAKWLRRHPKVLLVDEPTQGVDVAAKAGIHHKLLQAAETGTAVIVSSTDVDELAALCHSVIVLREGRIRAWLAGDNVTVSRISREVLESNDSEAV